MRPRVDSSATSPTNCAHRCSTSRATSRPCYDLGDQLSPEEEKREFLGVANAETDRLTRLVNDVLDLSRLESGRARCSSSPMSLRPAMEQTLRTYRLNADEIARCELELDVSRRPARGARQLGSTASGAWTILIGNALKFSRAWRRSGPAGLPLAGQLFGWSCTEIICGTDGPTCQL